MPHLIVDNLVKEYPTRAEPLAVLRGVSFEAAEAGSVAIMGPSGSGKSTLLNIIGTLEPATSGRLLLDGVDPSRLGEVELAVLRRRKVGLVFQDHHLLPQCTVFENVLLPRMADGPIPPEAAARARELLDRVGLGGRLDHRPAELSGGERQRAALARALVHRPALLLADEPTGNLDRSTADSVGQLLVELQRQEGSILIVVTHSPKLAGLMDRRFELDAGRLVPC